MTNDEAYKMIRLYSKANNFIFKDGKTKIAKGEHRIKHKLNFSGAIFLNLAGQWNFFGIGTDHGSNNILHKDTYKHIPLIDLLKWYNRKEVLNKLIDKSNGK
jgi:hypothetical protein